MAKKKPASPAALTTDEIEHARKWLAAWLKECVKRAVQPKPKARIVGVFKANGEPPDEFTIGVPGDEATLLQWCLDRQHAMHRHVLDTWLLETFNSRGGMILAECKARNWITESTVFKEGRHEVYCVEDAAAIVPRKSVNDEICEFVHRLRTKSDPITFERMPSLVKEEFGCEKDAGTIERAYNRWRNKPT